MPFKQVICDKCNKPVSQTMTSFDPDLNHYNVVVRCHGQFDRCTIPVGLFENGWYITEARAFRSRDADKPAEKTAPDSPPDTPKPLCLTCKSEVVEKPSEQVQTEDWALQLQTAL